MRIDHLSIGASVQAIEAFGLRVTPSPGGGHARMHLGGVYMEIFGPGPEPDGATAATWYPADMPDCVRELRRRDSRCLTSLPTTGVMAGALTPT